MKRDSKKGGKPSPSPKPQPAPVPLKPRKGLFIVLLILFLIWVGGLLTLYFTSVYPLRH